MTNYLLEIGLEEIPAHLVTPSINLSIFSFFTKVF